MLLYGLMSVSSGGVGYAIINITTVNITIVTAVIGVTHLLVALEFEHALEHGGAVSAVEGGVFVMHVCNVPLEAGASCEGARANFASVGLQPGMDGHPMRVQVCFLAETMLAVGASERP